MENKDKKRGIFYKRNCAIWVSRYLPDGKGGLLKTVEHLNTLFSQSKLEYVLISLKKVKEEDHCRRISNKETSVNSLRNN